MEFRISPQLILDKEEFRILDTAYSLVADMDSETEFRSCEHCPKYEQCDGMAKTCVFTLARKNLKEILDMAKVEEKE